MPILRAACVERVSTEEQALRGFSIDTQISNLEEYCKKNNMKIVDHYTDEGISGSLPPSKRPALQRLLNDVEAGKIDVILFTKLDRWFRSVKEYFKVQEILDAHNVEWKAIHENYDTSTANGQMAITIFLAVAQNERDRTAERIKVVLDHKRKNKEACFGGDNPLGYVKEKDKNGITRLVKDPETKQAMQDFWDILVETNNLHKAIVHMNRVYGITRHRKTWTLIKQREFYCGIYKGVQDFCEPYVTPENFLRLQEVKPVKATPTGRVYIFKSLLRCPKCGKRMSGDTNKRPYGLYKYYRCPDRLVQCDNSKVYSEVKIEKQLINKLADFLRDEIATVEIEQSKPKPKPKTDVKDLKEQLRRLTVAYLAGNKTDEVYLKEDAELKALIVKAEAIAPPPPRDVTPLKEMLETDFKSLYETLTEEEKQHFWSRLVREIQLENKDVKGVIFF